ncbi:MAG: isopenicillin N synthase family oxygenase [Novosphingobium sp.]|nr:isopenicillin N synthase family oxygenase [Novosphingobium sp.]
MSEMSHTALPVLSLDDDSCRFATALGECFREYGFALVTDHGIEPAAIEKGWAITKAFFALPETEKRQYHIPGGGGARGYTPFGTEVAKDAAIHDLKEFWHIGRELPDGDPRKATMPDNIWPDRPEGFRQAALDLYDAMDSAGATILSRIGLYLGADDTLFDDAIKGGNSVLRFLHYPPLPSETKGALRAQAHGDINLITLLLGAEEAGLQILVRDGTWLDINPPPGALVINIGDMLERLTNNVLPSTTHRVRNPDGTRARYSRYSMPFFLHLRSDYRMETLPCCISPDNPDRYPDVMTADQMLTQRLREIGLM